MTGLQLTVRTIGGIVGDYYGVRWDDIVSDRRSPVIVRPRHVIMWVARKATQLSSPEIGRRMGGRDHTTVLYGVDKIEKARATDVRLATEIAEIELLVGVEKETLTRMGLQPEADLDPLTIAQHVATAPNGEFSVSLPEIRMLAQAVLERHAGEAELLPDATAHVFNLVTAIDAYAATTRRVTDTKEQRVRERALADQWAAFAALTKLSDTLKKELSDERKA